jgi:hypothetical protein
MKNVYRMGPIAILLLTAHCSSAGPGSDDDPGSTTPDPSPQDATTGCVCGPTVDPSTGLTLCTVTFPPSAPPPPGASVLVSASTPALSDPGDAQCQLTCPWLLAQYPQCASSGDVGDSGGRGAVLASGSAALPWPGFGQ